MATIVVKALGNLEGVFQSNEALYADVEERLDIICKATSVAALNEKQYLMDDEECEDFIAEVKRTIFAAFEQHKYHPKFAPYAKAYESMYIIAFFKDGDGDLIVFLETAPENVKMEHVVVDQPGILH